MGVNRFQSVRASLVKMLTLASHFIQYAAKHFLRVEKLDSPVFIYSQNPNLSGWYFGGSDVRSAQKA